MKNKDLVAVQKYISLRSLIDRAGLSYYAVMQRIWRKTEQPEDAQKALRKAMWPIKRAIDKALDKEAKNGA